MYFVLLDSTGNLIASYRDEDEARAALVEIVEADPDAAEDIALMSYDDEGEIVDDAFFVPTVALVGDSEEVREWYQPFRVDQEKGEQTNHVADPPTVVAT